MKLNLGCKEHKFTGWVNIDINPKVNPDLVHDLLEPLPQEDNSVDEIYAGHLIEHIPYISTIRVIRDWYRVLKKGGEITLAFPDFEKVIQEYKEDRLDWYTMNNYLMANETHKQLISEKKLIEQMKREGFSEAIRLDTSPHLSGVASWQGIVKATK